MKLSLHIYTYKNNVLGVIYIPSRKHFQKALYNIAIFRVFVLYTIQ